MCTCDALLKYMYKELKKHKEEEKIDLGNFLWQLTDAMMPLVSSEKQCADLIFDMIKQKTRKCSSSLLSIINHVCRRVSRLSPWLLSPGPDH